MLYTLGRVLTYALLGWLLVTSLATVAGLSNNLQSVMNQLLGPVLMPWYVVWVLPLAWVLPKAPRTALIAVSALLGVTLWSTEALRYPGAFSLNVFVGNWFVVPVIVWLLIVLLRDLRSRIDHGALFEDEVGIEEPPPPLLDESGDEERVPAATGEGAGQG